MNHETIIVGAGPAGLYAAYLLAKRGRRCLLLEARSRIGGRAHSIKTPQVPLIETGAEFVHGRLPVSMQLLAEAGLRFTKATGQWVSLKGGLASPDEETAQWAELMRKLGGLDADLSLQAFLDTEFSDNRYAWLRDRAISYAEGYDSADASRVSARALHEEWAGEDENQFRIDAGYSALWDYLADSIRAGGSEIRLGTEVRGIEAAAGRIRVASGPEIFEAQQVIVAVPLGVLQQERISIEPRGGEMREVFRQMGFGDVIKFVLVFREAFWEDHFPGLGFLMSGADIPTWWTQAPQERNVLTGWLAGRTARIRSGLATEILRDMAVDSLSALFSKPRDVLEALLLELHVFNWSADPLTGGAYAYETPEAAAAREKLRALAPEGVSFIGEYGYAGPSMGTVEAAFRSAAALLHPAGSGGPAGRVGNSFGPI